jgi:hypothetical protein
MKLRAMLVVAAMTVALVGIGLVGQEPASAHDHLIPKTTLMKGATKLQTGLKVVDSSWTEPAGNGEFVTQTASYIWRFPEVDRVAEGSKLRVRVLKSQRPDTFSIIAYPKVDEGAPSGQGRQLGASFKPIVKDGRTVAWDVIFHVDRPLRDYYLVSEGHWKDRQGSDSDQWAHWSFHVKTGSSSYSVDQNT